MKVWFQRGNLFISTQVQVIRELDIYKTIRIVKYDLGLNKVSPLYKTNEIKKKNVYDKKYIYVHTSSSLQNLEWRMNVHWCFPASDNR